MARNQRVNISLTPELVERLDDIPEGERSREVRAALRRYWEL